MKSGFKLPLAIALALGSSSALALQLGEIRVKSALDEPLVAEIPIQLDNLVEAKDLRVGLATPADFAKAGLSRAGLEHLRFSVITDTTGHKLVLVTSEQPVGDPYLDFLIELDSNAGKQLREYTVLLDPVIASPPPEETVIHAAAPVVTPPSAASVAPAPQPAPPSPGAASTPAQQPAPAQTAPAQPAPSQPAPEQATPRAPPVQRANEYTVQSGDTLYRIASEMRPDEQVSVDQMMLALQSANPDAFYRDNINNLKSGAILRIPTRTAIESTSAAQARAQVHRQMEDWRGEAARRATTVAGNEAPAAAGSPAKSATGEGDKLALVPPTQGGGSAATRPGEKGGTGTAEVAGLKQQLATAKESLASVKQENADLQSRVKNLEDIGGKNQKLLGMKDAQIADLQNKLAELQHGAAAAAPAGNAPAPSASTASTAAAAATAAASAAVISGAATSAASTAPAPGQASSAAPAAVPQSRPLVKTAPTKTAQANTPAGPEGMPWYQRPVTWLVAGIVIVALILLGLLRRRPHSLPEPFDEEPDAPSLADQFGESSLPPLPLQHEGETTQHGSDPSAGSRDSAFDDDSETDAELEESAAVEPEAAESAEAEQDYDFAFDEPPQEEPIAEPGMAAPQPPVAGSDEITRRHDSPGLAEPASNEMAQTEAANEEITRASEPAEFSDDPVDTKLDLARAYLDMGDPAGARAMLEEVLNEGTQAQQEEAQRLLDGQS